MSEWQPVRIAPTFSCMPMTKEEEAFHRKVAGKIIRVCPRSTRCQCGGMAFEVHPDFRPLGAYDTGFVCEHQILAD